MMKKLFTLLIIGVLAICSLGSCSDEAFDVDSVNKQTILVFFPWTGSTNNSGLTYYLQANVDSICKGIVGKKGLNNTRVLLFFSDNVKHSTLYDLQYDESTKSVNRVPLKTYDEVNYDTPAGIADLLNEVKTQAEALNYALIIGSHGSGWTYTNDWVNYPYLARPSNGNTTSAQQQETMLNEYSFGDPNNPTTRFFGSVSMNSGGTSINVDDLAEGIKLSGMKMQYILFDACYMGNVETAYELKDVTNYLLSTSCEMMAQGVPYNMLWSYLNGTTPNYSSFISGMVNFYNGAYVPCCNMSAVDCRQLDGLAKVMKEINSKYTLSSTVPLDSIQALDGFSPHIFYDMSVYVDSLHPSGYLKDQFTAQLKKTIKAVSHTDYAFTELNTAEPFFRVKTYCGLSISDPSKHSVAIKGREKTAWWKATH